MFYWHQYDNIQTLQRYSSAFISKQVQYENYHFDPDVIAHAAISSAVTVALVAI